MIYTSNYIISYIINTIPTIYVHSHDHTYQINIKSITMIRMRAEIAPFSSHLSAHYTSSPRYKPISVILLYNAPFPVLYVNIWFIKSTHLKY